MINVYDLSNALPVAIFGMFALWAAVSRRHWFLRTAIVGGAILTTLLIPAYEVVILLTVQTAIVVAGVALWRRRRIRERINETACASGAHLRLSMETLLLAVAVVAVVTAVASRAPLIPLREWYQTSLNGVASGVTALICVWLVFGRARWWLRLLAVPPFIFTLTFTLTCLRWTGHITQDWYLAGRPLSEYVQLAMRDIGPATLSWAKPVALGMGILCLWMLLMHRAGWFDPFGEREQSPAAAGGATRRLAIARLGVVAFCCAAAIFPLVLFYRLVSPTPIPKVELPEPNGFDDFVVAARMISPADAAKLANWNPLPAAELRALLSRYDAVFDRARLGLQRRCWHPHGYVSRTTYDEGVLVPLISAMSARGALAERDESDSEQLSAYWDLLRVTFEADRGTGTALSVPAQVQGHAVRGLWNCRTRLSAQQCTELAADLWKLESSRESWQTKAKRQRIIEENIDWQWRLQAILADWSGTERNEQARQWQLLRMTEVRILIADLGIRAYQLDTGSLPGTLAQLAPRYLPAVPDDPYGKGAIKYRVSGSEYALYSVGPDGDDDSGRALSKLIDVMNGQTDQDGDLPDIILFPPAIATQPAATGDQSTDTNARRPAPEASTDGESENPPKIPKP